MIMERNDIDILRLCETRWCDKGDFYSDLFRVIYSGEESNGQHDIDRE